MGSRRRTELMFQVQTVTGMGGSFRIGGGE